MLIVSDTSPLNLLVQLGKFTSWRAVWPRYILRSNGRRHAARQRARTSEIREETRTLAESAGSINGHCRRPPHLRDQQRGRMLPDSKTLFPSACTWIKTSGLTSRAHFGRPDGEAFQPA